MNVIRLFISFAILCYSSTFVNSSIRDRRQVYYFDDDDDDDYYRPHDPAAYDPEVIREIEMQKRSKYGGGGFGDYYLGLFSNQLPVISEATPDAAKTREKREIRESKNVTEVARRPNMVEAKNETGSGGKQEEAADVSDNEASSSRFRPIRGDRNRFHRNRFRDDDGRHRRRDEEDDDGFEPRRNYRRRPDYRSEEFRRPSSGPRRFYYDDTQQPRSSRQSSDAQSRKFAFPGIGTKEFLAQFASLFHINNRKKSRAASNKISDRELLGSGNFEILAGGIYSDDPDVNDYESIARLADHRRRRHRYFREPEESFDSPTRFFDRIFDREALSEKRQVVRLPVDNINDPRTGRVSDKEGASVVKNSHT